MQSRDKAEPDAKDSVPGFPYVVNLLMQTEDQVNSAEGQQCTATIVSPYWIATSESCCDGAVKGILEFDDFRTGSSGNKSFGRSTVNVPCRMNCGRRRRRSIEFHHHRTKRDTEPYNDATCISTGFCKKNGICLIRSG